MALRDYRPDPPAVSAYNEILRILKADGPLSALGVVWRDFDGEAIDAAPFGRSDSPHARLLFSVGEHPWSSPAGTTPDGALEVEMAVQGFDQRDVQRLWHAMIRAFYPRGDEDRARSIRQRLIAAGCEHGVVRFAGPDIPRPAAQAGRILATGSMTFQLRNDIDP